MLLRLRVSSVVHSFFLLTVVLSSSCLRAADILDAPAFSATPEALRLAAAGIKPEKDAAVTILLNDSHFTFARDGKVVETYHSIYRIETEEGAEGWSEVNSNWEPWHQSKPEIRARVLTVDGAVHVLDPKTLTDVPVHENSPDTYTDERAVAGPLPAIAVGAIVEEETILRDTSTFFAAGQVTRLSLDRSVVVNKTRVVLIHPEALQLRYVLKKMPNARINKTTEAGLETITIDDGPYAAREEKPTYVPPDAATGQQVEFSTGASWAEIAREYTRLYSDKVRVADVQPLLATLNLKGASREAKIRKIVQLLHKNIRYTGVEFGEDSIVPQFPAETLKRKYGDCKDKATLLVTMLRAAEIPAALALLQAGPGEDINPELPGMGMFDHAIVYVYSSGSDPELWIDATAQYTQVGFLPTLDYSRWALIADEKTTELKKIPQIHAEQNLHRETREFTMAEFGHAKIVETDEQIGPGEESQRTFYTGDAKKLRENSEAYVKNAYLADSLISLDHDDLTNMEKPFKVTYVTKGRRGNTDLTTATMAIRQEDLFDGLPEYFYKKEDQAKAENKEDKPAPRTMDWWFSPFVNEWHYRIIAPPGFKLRALPPNKEDAAGTIHYVQKYSANGDGTIVEALFRFEHLRYRVTPEEAVVMRDWMVRARAADPILIAFDQVGAALLTAGKYKEAIAAYQQLATQHPKEALHKIQLAHAYLSAGLGDRARTVAREATTLEPTSAHAFSTLAWILQHDLIGRRFKKGFDYEGAVAAYQKARQLDPKDKDIRANLAVLLEVDPDGIHYGPKSRLEEAVNEFRDLKKMDESYGRSYDDNVGFDLWYARKPKELREFVSSLPATDQRKAFIVASIAYEQGAEAALKKSLELTTEEQARSKVLTGAGALLFRVRKYGEAADLFTEGARGQANETQTLAYVALLRKTKPVQEIGFPNDDPRSVVQRLFVLMLDSKMEVKQIRPLFARKVAAITDAESEKEFVQQMSGIRHHLESAGVPLDVVVDMTMSNLRYSLEGSDALGYKITLELPGGEKQKAFVTREDGQWKLVDLLHSSSPIPESMAWEVLTRVDRNDLDGARKWLDWARDEIHINQGDDPLAGQPFPYFWTKDKESDADKMRTAALVLLPSKELTGELLAKFIEIRNKTAPGAERNRLSVVLAFAYWRQERWQEMQPVADELLQVEPDSFLAFVLATSGYGGKKQFDSWEKILSQALQKHSDEPIYIRNASQLAAARGQFVQSRQYLKSLMDHGQANASDLNSYAWSALFIPGQANQDAIDAAQSGNDLTKNQDFSILHTQATLYAEVGKTNQARDLLLKALDAEQMDEPNPAIWLVFGKIAEQYGEFDAARTLYSRIEKLRNEQPVSNYSLAQQYLLALKGVGTATAQK